MYRPLLCAILFNTEWFTALLMSFCSMSFCRMSFWLISLCRVSFCCMSFCSMSFYWILFSSMLFCWVINMAHILANVMASANWIEKRFRMKIILKTSSYWKEEDEEGNSNILLRSSYDHLTLLTAVKSFITFAPGQDESSLKAPELWPVL